MIQTVKGAMTVKDIDIGNILIHEHVRCASNDMMHIFGKRWIDEEYLVAYASQILKEMQTQYNVGLYVDATPVDLGRDVKLLERISVESGVPIVASTGLYWFPDCMTIGNTEQEIARWFIEEYKYGMEGTDIKPGILKCATGDTGLDLDNVKRIGAMGIAQKETGLPLYVHCSHKEDVTERQMNILRKKGADPKKIIVGHAVVRPDLNYLIKILENGCNICMDQWHCTAKYRDEAIGSLVALCEKGYTDRIVLSMDQCIYSDFGTRNNTGLKLSVQEQVKKYECLFNVIASKFLEAGGKREDWESLVRTNSLRLLDI